jgi:hypothetical protein
MSEILHVPGGGFVWVVRCVVTTVVVARKVLNKYPFHDLNIFKYFRIAIVIVVSTK